MRYIVHDKGKVIDTFETTGEYTVTYPSYNTESITTDKLDGILWKDVVDNPEKYVYKDGQVIKANA